MPWVSKKWIELVEQQLSDSYWKAHNANVRCNNYENQVKSIKDELVQLRKDQQRTSQWVRTLKRELIKTLIPKIDYQDDL